jgi:hypothetical protein
MIMANEHGGQMTIQDPFSFRDMNSLRFLAQFFFSTLILSFCLMQLTRTDIENKNPALYWSCLTGILALWMPSPATARAGTASSEPENGATAHPSLAYPTREALDESKLEK